MKFIIQFKSEIDGKWFNIHGRTYLFHDEARRDLAALRRNKPGVEYRIV